MFICAVYCEFAFEKNINHSIILKIDHCIALHCSGLLPELRGGQPYLGFVH